jgi:hypothetical protein
MIKICETEQTGVYAVNGYTCTEEADVAFLPTTEAEGDDNKGNGNALPKCNPGSWCHIKTPAAGESSVRFLWPDGTWK